MGMRVEGLVHSLGVVGVCNLCEVFVLLGFDEVHTLCLSQQKCRLDLPCVCLYLLDLISVSVERNSRHVYLSLVLVVELVYLLSLVLVVLAWRMLCFVEWRFVLEMVLVDLV